ncbi:MAG: hypothetical protein HC803_09305 [Saprospiraceae bacterium]|nr:hypothetical protein [Saprospiraceae bacterium]
MKNLLLTIAFCAFFIGNIFSQNEKSRNWAVEMGGSTGQLFSKIIYAPTNLDTTIYHNWTKFRPMPTVKISRTFNTSGTIHSTIQTFVGFSVIGTETDWEEPTSITATNLPEVPFFIREPENTYYYIPSLEMGSFFNFPIKNFEIGVGLKGQYHLKLWTNDHYLKTEVTSMNPTIYTSENVYYDLTTVFTRLSVDAGLRVQYNFNRFFMATEGWYGMTNISKFQYDGIDYRQNETNVRLMVGYRF